MINDVTVILTSGCTMSCKYCFEHQRDHSKDSTMKPSTLIDIFDKYQSLGNPFDFHLFGGEPTLNMSALNEFVKHLEEYGEFPTDFYIDIQTNLYEVSAELYDALQRLSKVSHRKLSVCVSIDGISNNGNKYRVNHDGESTFSTVYNNLMHLREVLPNAEIRTHSVISDANAPEFTNLVLKLKSLYDDGIIDNFGMNWIDPDTVGVELSNETIDLVMIQYWKDIQPKLISDGYTEEMQSSFMAMGLDIDLHYNKDLDDNYNICGAGSTMTAYLPSGEEIPCHKFIDKRASFTKINTDNYPPNVRKMIGENRFECVKCPLRFSCHTCIASNELYGGNLYQKSSSQCRRWRYLIKTALQYKLEWAKNIQKNVLDEQARLSNEILSLTTKVASRMVDIND